MREEKHVITLARRTWHYSGICVAEWRRSGLEMVITKLDMFRQLQVMDEEGVFDYTIANRAFW